MKAGHDIIIDAGRDREPAGGVMAQHAPVAQGRVQLLSCPEGDVAQAMAAIDDLVRLSKLDPGFSWSRTAIVAREWRRLESVRAYADTLGIPAELANETLLAVWRLREMQAFVAGCGTVRAGWSRSRICSISSTRSRRTAGSIRSRRGSPPWRGRSERGRCWPLMPPSGWPNGRGIRGEISAASFS